MKLRNLLLIVTKNMEKKYRLFTYILIKLLKNSFYIFIFLVITYMSLFILKEIYDNFYSRASNSIRYVLRDKYAIISSTGLTLGDRESYLTSCRTDDEKLCGCVFDHVKDEYTLTELGNINYDIGQTGNAPDLFKEAVIRCTYK